MALSRTQQALAYVAAGETVKAAAAKAGVAGPTLRVAIARARGKEVCPCCRQVVRDGFEVAAVPKQSCGAEVSAAVATDRRRIALVLAASIEQAGAETSTGRIFKAIADRIDALPL